MRLPDHLKIFISGSFVSILGNLLLGGANYLTRRTMAVNLSQSDYGCFYGAFALISVILVLFYNGVNDACTVLISSKPDCRKKIFFTLWKWKGIAGSVCVLFLLALSPWISAAYLHNATPWLMFFLSFYVLFQTLNGTIISYTTGCKRFKMKSFLQVIKAVVLLGLAEFLTRRYGITGAAMAYAFSALLLEPFHIWWVCHDNKGCSGQSFSPDLRKDFLPLTGMISAITFLQMLLMHTSSIMLMFLMDTESTAVFNVAQPIAQLFLSFLVFHQVFLPIAIEMVQKKKLNKLRLYAGFGILITVITLPVLYLLLYCTSHWLITFLFSRKYADQASEAMIILMLGLLLNASASFITQILIAMKKMSLLLWGLISTLLINIVFNFILIKYMGINGASWATALSYLFLLLFVIAAFYSVSSKGDSRTMS